MSVVLHATAVSFGGHAIVITGASGAGKSTLGWMLLGLGGTLVADDRVQAERREDGLWLTAPEQLQGKIEARGIGIVQTPWAPAWARLVVDLDQVETDRVPNPRSIEIAEVELPLILRVESPGFAPMLRAYLLGGRWDGSNQEAF